MLPRQTAMKPRVFNIPASKPFLPVLIHSLRAGELVIAVGNPLGFAGALSTGIVHSNSDRWIHADVRLAPGNSGGPLANALGEKRAAIVFNSRSSAAEP